MGEPVKIVDLAKNLIKLSGFNEGEIGIEFSGIRPGEKLFEELLNDHENTIATHHEKILKAMVSEYEYNEVCQNLELLLGPRWPPLRDKLLH